MIIVIKYRARLTYTDSFDGREFEHTNSLCDVTHTINDQTLETTAFEFKPVVEEDK